MNAAEYQEALDRLVATGRKRLRRFVIKKEVQNLGVWALYAIATASVLILLMTGIHAVVPHKFVEVGWQELLYLPVAGLALFCLIRLIFPFKDQTVERAWALALYDKQLELKDDLQIVDEFLQSNDRTDFQNAAIAGSKHQIEAAIDFDLKPVSFGKVHFRRPRWIECMVSLVLLMAASFALALNSFELLTSELTVDTVKVADADQQPNQSDESAAQNENPERSSDEMSSDNFIALVSSSKSLTSRLQDPTNQEPGAQTTSQQPNISANADSQSTQSSNSQQSTGFKSDSDPQEENPHSQSKKNKESDKEQQPKAPSPSPEMSSNQLSGTSKSSSSSKVSTSSSDSSNFPTREDNDLDEESMESEDEEDEEQDAGASSKPMIEQRKAPADRQLSPSGAGPQQENPDANGRSGAGGLKKTRGVAAKLLGVPMPDQLSGHTNPGRMKISRKNSEPNVQLQDLVGADSQGTIDQSIGAIPQPKINPWMKRLIQDYFSPPEAI